ncbi:nucleoside phosphorylase [Geomonas sp. Red69]|uniref:phosphorylase family protein n=1 Tax=Geomonas diazotrophica TaxID=2843197 RepID=UPI001C1082FD|nr:MULTISPECIES: nucleoside phosphorylase [Geomonas]MBU5638284.1 nucleoside phosphorylase [Geomonas diazotrophica]QXE85815.1 nucleoside phosphorylase [Geomonas nitrogeniifigens]
MTKENRNLGVVAAMPQEIAPVLARIKGYAKGNIDGRNLYRFPVNGSCVYLIESGMGPAQAAAATRALIRHAQPDAILNFGFGGAVLPGLEVGELVLADRVFRLDQGIIGELPQPDSALAALIQDYCAKVGLQLRRGGFITACGIRNKGEMASRLGGSTALPLLEMETAAVLEQAQAAGIPLVSVRGVSDAADEELGFTIEEFCDANLNLNPWRVAWTISKRPWLIPQLVRLAGNSRRAGKRLALAVELALQALTRQT